MLRFLLVFLLLTSCTPKPVEISIELGKAKYAPGERITGNITIKFLEDCQITGIHVYYYRVGNESFRVDLGFFNLSSYNLVFKKGVEMVVSIEKVFNLLESAGLSVKAEIPKDIPLGEYVVVAELEVNTSRGVEIVEATKRVEIVEKKVERPVEKTEVGRGEGEKEGRRWALRIPFAACLALLACFIVYAFRRFRVRRGRKEVLCLSLGGVHLVICLTLSYWFPALAELVYRFKDLIVGFRLSYESLMLGLLLLILLELFSGLLLLYSSFESRES